MAPPGEDPAAVQDRERATGSGASVGWKTYGEARVAFSRPVSEAMIRRARTARGMRVLDLASGLRFPGVGVR